MKTTKTSILLIAFLIFTTILNAQPQFNAEERAKIETEWMKTDLNLDQSTALSVETINLKYANIRKSMMQEIRNGQGQGQGQGNREGMRDEMKSLNVKKNNELKLILTQEQYIKYLELAPEKNRNNRDSNSRKTEGKRKGKRRM